MSQKINEYFITPSIRTDLALEAHEVVKERRAEELPGVKSETRKTQNAVVTRMEIFSPQGEQILGKAQGNYVTIEAKDLTKRSKIVQEEVSHLIVEELERLLPQDDNATFLVVGLGNWNATPDALGPQVVSKLLVSRHLFEHAPPELTGGMRQVSALAPGVLGLTGIETGEIIKGVVDRIHPSAVIVIDALAARNAERISTTIQIADTGINPGAGVGNKRMSITKGVLGIPVIAIGVPTVVHALTIINNALTIIGQELNDSNRIRLNTEFSKTVERLAEEEKDRLIADILSPSLGELIVTPKEIDVIIEDISQVVAAGINGALHTGIALEELFSYTH